MGLWSSHLKITSPEVMSPDTKVLLLKVYSKVYPMTASESKGLDFQETALWNPKIEFYQLSCHHEKIQELTF